MALKDYERYWNSRNQDDQDLLNYLYKGLDGGNTAKKNAKILLQALRWHHMKIFKSWFSKILVKILPEGLFKIIQRFYNKQFNN